jgi:hypothetical protein
MCVPSGDIWTVYWPMLFGEPADYQRKVPDHELFSEARHV